MVITYHLCLVGALSNPQQSFMRVSFYLIYILLAEERVNKLMDDCEDVDLVFLCFARTFVSVSYRLRVLKLQT